MKCPEANDPESLCASVFQHPAGRIVINISELIHIGSGESELLAIQRKFAVSSSYEIFFHPYLKYSNPKIKTILYTDYSYPSKIGKKLASNFIIDHELKILSPI